MPYSAEISRNNPSCFLFLIDQSASMADLFGSGESKKKKADGVADAINNLLRELSIRCAKDEGIRNYFHIGVIGYGAKVGPAFGGALSGKELVPIRDVAENPAQVDERAVKVEDGSGGLVSESRKIPVWFEPVANGGTPMCQAFGMAKKVVQGFLSQHPGCFPPVIIHFTDGESTDGDPTGAMQQLASLSSSDGDVLLFNYHISSTPSVPVAFPGSADALPPDQYARMLFDAASQLTPYMRDVAKKYDFQLPEGAKGYTFNADLVLVIQALDIGTRPSELR